MIDGRMWRSFDLVGVTEHFDEFVVLLAELVGLASIAYRSQLATKKTTEVTTSRLKVEASAAGVCCLQLLLMLTVCLRR